MRNIGVCQLFSEVCGGTISCGHPEKKKCGFEFYNLYGTGLGKEKPKGITMTLCRHRIDELGFKKCWEEMEILIKWSKDYK